MNMVRGVCDLLITVSWCSVIFVDPDVFPKICLW